MNVTRRALRMSGACLLVILHGAVFPSLTTAEHLQAFVDRWNTLRETVDNQGLTLETVNTNDILINASGGLRNRTAFFGDLDLLLTVDAEKLAGWRDATFFVYGLGLYGDGGGADIREQQTISSIAAPNSWRLFEAWYQQNLLDGQVSFLGGLYDITSEFDVIRASSELFVNSSFGTNPEFASIGRNGLSTFPFSSLGLRGQVVLTPDLTLRAVIADGVPGDPGDTDGTDVILKSEDGILVVTELAYYLDEQHGEAHAPESVQGERPRRLLFRRIGRAAELDYRAKYAIGVWALTTELDDLNDQDINGNPVRRDGTHGLYGLAEHRVYREPDQVGDLDQGLILFLQVGYADPKVNRFSNYFGGGLVYRGLFPGRDQDETGFGFAIARNGTDYKSGQRAAGVPVHNEEVALELTHSLVVTQSFIIQPDIQYIINPGTDPSIPDAFVIGARLELNLNWFK